METDLLKSAWNIYTGEKRESGQLKSMLKESAHPVLRNIRRQLLIETALFSIFGLLYYDLFDGNQKPLYANFLLVFALILIIGHNFVGYIASKSLIQGPDLRQSLSLYYTKLRKYAIFSVFIRVFASASVIAFFISIIHFSTIKYTLLACCFALIIGQGFIQWKIWRKRLDKLSATLADFTD